MGTIEKMAIKRKIEYIEYGEPGKWGFRRAYITTKDGEVWMIRWYLRDGNIECIKKIENPFPLEVWEEIGVIKITDKERNGI